MRESAFDLVNVLWRPQFLLATFISLASFGLTTRINVTNLVFLESPNPIGYGYKRDIVLTLYLTPIVGVLLLEVLAKLFNKHAVHKSVRRDKGVFKSEDTLIGTIPGLLIYVVGMVLFGWTIQHNANIAGVGNVFIIVAVISYASANLPGREGECSALLNMAHILGGFAVPYFQVQWIKRHGALQEFSVEGAAVSASG